MRFKTHVPDVPGALAAMLQTLADRGGNVELFRNRDEARPSP